MIADEVWQYLGDVDHYIEPFFGSGAVLLNRPHSGRRTETVNDKDGFIANVWRALQFAPDEVAKWCDWPVNHADLSARKAALIRNESRLLENLIADEKWFDPVMAGYWIWAASCWIGSGLTSGKGIHTIGESEAGEFESVTDPYNTGIYKRFRDLSERLRYVRVVCGDWNRVCGGNWQDKMGTVGIFFDPPYSDKAGRDESLYQHESLTVAHDVREWCIERGKRPTYRIVLAGYYDEHVELLEHGWTAHRWSANVGYSNTGNDEGHNRHKETLFVSPHCQHGKQTDLFGNRPPLRGAENQEPKEEDV